MQFITNGPNIPDKLLQAHEEGHVVFFCGAGISYPAGLQGFKGLVDQIYSLVGTTCEVVEKEAYSRSQFDATLDLLERRLPGQRIAVRKALFQALQPNFHLKGATNTHTALLQLAHDRKGASRLVTTNFDRIFEYVIKRDKLKISSYAAPMLPVPKNSRWNGLVYLHGLLPEKVDDDSALHRLVLTSGDFGLAYLTERWAARFVSELFRNYVVCFVGYSINDPVLRYMMDALAADRMLGEVTPQAYAFGDCSPGKERSKTIEWEAKGVTPILYEVPSGTHDHQLLYRTLKVWAEIYRDGILGKERIVINHALTQPTASTQQDDFVGRMLWALSDESGLPAKRFAEFNPVPALTWLDAFCKNCYKHDDLIRFGVPPTVLVNDNLRFSLIYRPAPYSHAPWMSLVYQGPSVGHWDAVMLYLAHWLMRHLNDPVLIIWLAQRGGQLHDIWIRMIKQELDHFIHLEQEGKTTELEEIRINAPNAIPGPLMLKLWNLLLNGQVKSPGRNTELYRWKEYLKRDGLNTTLRMELRKLLTPKITLGKPFRWDETNDNNSPPKFLKQLVDCELVLVADYVYSSIRDLDCEHWREALPLLLDDFQQLLRDALDILCELGEANDHSDLSHWDLPSITPHSQNQKFHEWVVLIELLRDAWLSIYENDPERATKIAQNWFSLPYSTFKRLALFAASKDGCISPDQWVDWLIVDHAWWLWSVDTQRETMRLFILQGTNLSPTAEARLETAILAGPPRIMFIPNLPPEDWQFIVDNSVWLRLAKLREGAGKLGNAATQRFEELSEANSKWKLASDDRDEFSHWTSGTGDPDYEFKRKKDIAPRKQKELIEWLKQPPSDRRPFYEDNWFDTCRTRCFRSFCALRDLAQEGIWPGERWSDALQAWGEEDKVLRSWRFAAPIVQKMPDVVLQKVVYSITWWLEVVSKSIDHHEDILLDLCHRILTLPYQKDGDSGQPVNRAINNPVGKVTRTLLNLWLKRNPNDNDMLPEDIEPFFTRLCDVKVEQFRHGRVLLASQLITLFRVDRLWTETHMLSLFNWATNAIEAKAAWEGFLWSPRLFQPLMIAFKTQFLETATHYLELGEYSRPFATFLTFAALDPMDGYTRKDFQAAIGALPQEGLNEVALALLQALEGAGEQREDYWKNRIKPFWQNVWPKLRDLASNGIAESLARLCIEAYGEFPDALTKVQGWLQPIEHPHTVVLLLHESRLSGRYPAEALTLLDAVLFNHPWVPNELKHCLDDISKASPQLIEDSRFKRLSEYIRRHSI